jgi:hypothetical protein
MTHGGDYKYWCFLWCDAGRVKVKHSLFRLGQALSVAEGWGLQISRQWAQDGSKVVSRTHRPPLFPRKYCWHSFLLQAESTLGSWCSWKDYVNFNTMNEPMTFRFVAQCVTPCSQVYRHQNYGETRCLHIQDRSFETFVLNYKNLAFSLPRTK